MAKLVILQFGSGTLATGYPVTLRLGPEGEQAHTELAGGLPPLPDLGDRFQDWQTTYRNLDFSGRPLALKKSVSRFASPEDCQQAAVRLGDRLNHWLRSESFRPLREIWLEKLKPEDTIRLAVQTQDLSLQRLPWHLWEVLERYPQTEVVLSAPSYDRIESPRGAGAVKILAILGDRTGIDIERDRTLLESLPQAEVSFLVEPSAETLTDQLWDQPWQILFFAGHSASLGPEALGKFGINAQESLTIAELKYALRNAVTQGLRLAIFNSCDGLGLARQFADLQIPHLIVMREPVPDQVAQRFLQYLLAAFQAGLPLHLSVRQARERLQSLEKTFPCATFLPVLFQNLAQPAITWRSLQNLEPDPDAQPQKTPNPGTSEHSAPPLDRLVVPQHSSPPSLRPWPLTRRAIATALALSSAVAATTLGLRHLGWLQTLELQAYDHLLTQRPAEPRDPRLLVITVTEEDVNNQPERGRSSLSDAALAQLLNQLQPHQPALIGLDIYRDFPVDDRYPELAQVIAQNDRFIGICRVEAPQQPAIDPPPELPGDRIGFSDLVLDRDGTVRRHLLALTPPATSPCQASLSLSLELALRYLALQGILLQEQDNGHWQLGQAHIRPLDAHTGPYQAIDAWGYQMLLNYRQHNSLSDFTEVISLGDVLDGKLNPDVIRDRIILIGTTAPSFSDYVRTPYGSGENDLAGVMLQAQMVSQLISAAQGDRPLIQALPWLVESGWIVLWAVVGGGLVLLIPQPAWRWLGGGIATGLLYATCWGLMAHGSVWIPLAPPLLGLWGSGIALAAYSRFQTSSSQTAISKRS